MNKNYTIKFVSNIKELDKEKVLPLEIQFIIKNNPELKERIKLMMGVEGKSIGVLTLNKTPQSILDDVNNISKYSQHFMILSWLSDLLKNDVFPKFTKEEIETAKLNCINLENAAENILSQKYNFKRIILINKYNNEVTKDDKEFIDLLNNKIKDISVDWCINRIIMDNANERTRISQTIIKSLLIIGPITHILEMYVRGIGKVFAASADDILSEAAELSALRGAGFSWKFLAKRCKVLIPVFIVATFFAFNVEHFIDKGEYIKAGLLFGLSAVMLSLTTAIQSIFMYLNSIKKLVFEKKLKLDNSVKQLVLAFKQDFTNPARLGLGIGAICSPIIAMFIFSFFPFLTHNGWVLAFVGSIESFVAALTIFASKYINQKRFEFKLKKLI
jgi:hypothetical protein